MISGHYNLALVALSIAIAVIASYTALDLANRVSENAANPKKAWTWLAAGAAAMGSGIWSMHFIGMLAFDLPIPMAYNIPITALSLMIAIVVSAVALFVVRKPQVQLLSLSLGATLMGIGIAAMHYTGMLAMQMFPPIHYDALLFTVSVVIAISASVAALWIVVRLRRTGSHLMIPARLGSAVVMGIAIAGMHYTGMAAAQFAPGSVCLAVRSAGIQGGPLAVVIGCIAMAILALTLILSTLDGHIAHQNALLAKSLRVAKDEAEAALRENRAITAELQAAQGQLTSAARKAGMAEIASSVLHNVGNVLNSVTVSATLIGNRIRESKVSGVLQSVELMNAHAADLGAFMSTDPKGQRLLPYLNQLLPVISREKADLLEESAALLRSVEHIKEIVATQQSYAGSAVVVESLDVASLIDDALRINAQSMAKHAVTVSRALSALPRLLLDKHLMLQILVNLITNAVQAMQNVSDRPRALTVQMTLEAVQPAKLQISIEDNGEGIAPESLGRLFEHGFTTRKSGHGFGLHSSALAARAMGGSLSGRNVESGTGAVFTLILPARLAAVEAA